MKSRLSPSLIKSKLLKNTKAVNIYILFSPVVVFNLFSETNKIFLGEIKKDGFKITLNKSLYPIPYFIEGSFKEAENNESEIEYTVKPRKYVILFSNILQIVISIIIISTILIIAKIIVGIALVLVYILIAIVLPRYILRHNKKFMEQELREIMKIY